MACISNNMNWRFSPSLETITKTLLHSAMTARIKQMVKVSTHHHTTPTCSEVQHLAPHPTRPATAPLVLHQKHNDVQKIGEGPKRLKPRHAVRPLHPAHLPQLAPDVLAQHRLDGPRRDGAEIAPRRPVRCHVVEGLGLPLIAAGRCGRIAGSGTGQRLLISTAASMHNLPKIWLHLSFTGFFEKELDGLQGKGRSSSKMLKHS